MSTNIAAELMTIFKNGYHEGFQEGVSFGLISYTIFLVICCIIAIFIFKRRK